MTAEVNTMSKPEHESLNGIEEELYDIKRLINGMYEELHLMRMWFRDSV